MNIKTLRQSMAATVLAAAFAAPAAGYAQTQTPDMPERACAPLLGGDDSAAGLCAESLRHWGDVYAREQETYIENEQANRALPLARELTYLGDIRSNCEAMRGQTGAETLADSVLATDQCLRKAYEYGRIGGTNTYGIVKVGETLQAVGRHLQSRAPQ